MPEPRSERGFRLGSAAFWSLTWSVGVAIGVALGGWLTVVGGSGAPGTSALDVTHDLVVVPVISGLVAFAALFLGRVIVALYRSRSA